MLGAVAHPLVQRIVSYQASMANGDFNAGRTIFAPDVRYIVPGKNVLSGTFSGPDDVMGYFGRLMQVTNGSYEIIEMNWLVCGEKVILETKNRATMGERNLTWDEAILFEFEGGLKKRIEMFQADQTAVDHFFGA
jgi:uncharacterized protein